MHEVAAGRMGGGWTMTRLATCAWCGQQFSYEPQRGVVRLYCKKGHKERARVAHKNFRSHMTDGVCPTPKKRKFRDHHEALAVLKDNPWLPGNRPYTCTCGAVHIGRVKRDVHSKETLEQWAQERRDAAP